MARTVTLNLINTRIRQRTDTESTTFRITDTELTDHINEGIAELYDLIRASFGDDYYRSAYSFSTVAGTADYALPGDFLSEISIDITVSSGIVTSASKYQERERNIFRNWNTAGWVTYAPIYYRLLAGNVHFIPTPTSVFPITLNYVPTPPRLSIGSDTFDGISGWEEYVVLCGALKVQIKNGDPDGQIPLLLAQKAELKERIQTMAAERDADPDVVEGYEAARLRRIGWPWRGGW